jgi:lysozyme
MLIDYHRLVSNLKRHEGLRLKVYQCSANKNTIGYGRNLDDVGISEVEAEVLLKGDIQVAMNELLSLDEFRRVMNPLRREVLINMRFNLGMSRLMGFVKMWQAIDDENWEAASKEMLDSLWAKQVGSRATELAEQMRTGVNHE